MQGRVSWSIPYGSDFKLLFCSWFCESAIRVQAATGSSWLWYVNATLPEPFIIKSRAVNFQIDLRGGQWKTI